MLFFFSYGVAKDFRALGVGWKSSRPSELAKQELWIEIKQIFMRN